MSGSGFCRRALGRSRYYMGHEERLLLRPIL